MANRISPTLSVNMPQLQARTGQTVEECGDARDESGEFAWRPSINSSHTGLCGRNILYLKTTILISVQSSLYSAMSTSSSTCESLSCSPSPYMRDFFNINIRSLFHTSKLSKWRYSRVVMVGRKLAMRDVQAAKTILRGGMCDVLFHAGTKCRPSQRC
jgi:hypothetical protein